MIFWWVLDSSHMVTRKSNITSLKCNSERFTDYHPLCRYVGGLQLLNVTIDVEKENKAIFIISKNNHHRIQCKQLISDFKHHKKITTIHVNFLSTPLDGSSVLQIHCKRHDSIKSRTSADKSKQTKSKERKKKTHSELNKLHYGTELSYFILF